MGIALADDKVDDGDLQIYHDGSNSFIKTLERILQLNTNYFQVKNADDIEFIIQASQMVQYRLDMTTVKTCYLSDWCNSYGTLAAAAVTGDGSGLTGLAVGLPLLLQFRYCNHTGLEFSTIINSRIWYSTITVRVEQKETLIQLESSTLVLPQLDSAHSSYSHQEQIQVCQQQMVQSV